MGRYIVKGEQYDEEVIGDEFKIAGSDEVFVVHPAIGIDAQHKFTVTHMGTGFLIGRGETIDEAIKSGTQRWLEQSPEKLAAFIARAYAKAAERDCVRLEAGAA